MKSLSSSAVTVSLFYSLNFRLSFSFSSLTFHLRAISISLTCRVVFLLSPLSVLSSSQQLRSLLVMHLHRLISTTKKSPSPLSQMLPYLMLLGHDGGLEAADSGQSTPGQKEKNTTGQCRRNSVASAVVLVPFVRFVRLFILCAGCSIPPSHLC